METLNVEDIKLSKEAAKVMAMNSNNETVLMNLIYIGDSEICYLTVNNEACPIRLVKLGNYMARSKCDRSKEMKSYLNLLEQAICSKYKKKWDGSIEKLYPKLLLRTSVQAKKTINLLKQIDDEQFQGELLEVEQVESKTINDSRLLDEQSKEYIILLEIIDSIRCICDNDEAHSIIHTFNENFLLDSFILVSDEEFAIEVKNDTTDLSTVNVVRSKLISSAENAVKKIDNV